MAQFDNRLRQIIMLLVIGFIVVLIIKELYIFLPGFLGAITFYILGRDIYFKLVEEKGWKKGLTALLFMFAFLLVIGFPIYYAVTLVTPKINAAIAHSDELKAGLETFSERISNVTGQDLLTEENITKIQENVTTFIPSFFKQYGQYFRQPAGYVFCTLFHALRIQIYNQRNPDHQRAYDREKGKNTCKKTPHCKVF